jgi:hypothetical protein
VEGWVVDDAHRAEMDEPPDAGLGRGPEHEPRPFRVDQPEARAAVPVARDRREVEHRLGAVEGGRQRLGPGDVAGRRREAGALSGGEAAPDGLARMLGADERVDVVPGVEERRDEVAADEPVGAGDEDRGHGVRGLRGGAGSVPRSARVR